jgi:hypothetical protein
MFRSGFNGRFLPITLPELSTTHEPPIDNLSTFFLNPWTPASSMVNSHRWQTCRRKFSPCRIQIEWARPPQPLDSRHFPKTKTGQNRTKPDETPPSPRNGPLINSHLQPQTGRPRPILPSRNPSCNHVRSGILALLPASLRLRAFALNSLSSTRLSSPSIIFLSSFQIRVHPCSSVVASLFAAPPCWVCSW